MIATVVGACWGALLAPLIPSGAVAIGFSVLLAMITCQIFAGAGGARVAAFICGIIVLDNPSEPWSYAFHRLAETALGVAVGWAISFVPKLFDFGEASCASREDFNTVLVACNLRGFPEGVNAITSAASSPCAVQNPLVVVEIDSLSK